MFNDAFLTTRTCLGLIEIVHDEHVIATVRDGVRWASLLSASPQLYAACDIVLKAKSMRLDNTVMVEMTVEQYGKFKSAIDRAHRFERTTGGEPS